MAASKSYLVPLNIVNVSVLPLGVNSRKGDLVALDKPGDPQDGHLFAYSGGSWLDLNDPGTGGGEINTASNVNTGVGSVGIFKQKTGVNLEFKGINILSNRLSIVNNTTDNTIDLDVNQGNINHNVLTNYSANQHIDHSGITVTGATSLTGGGDLTANRTLSLVNDSSTPGNKYVYSTNGSGTKGWNTADSLITSGGVTSALGFTPYNAANPSGYITSSALSSYAPLASPALTGNPTAPTQTGGDNTTRIATTAFVQAAIPSLSGYAPLASPTFTGTPLSTTATVNTNTTQIATTAFVVGQASATNPLMNGTVAVGTSLRYAREDHVHASDTSRAPLASPTFTGTPLSTTATTGTNTTQIATTAFVQDSKSAQSVAITTADVTATAAQYGGRIIIVTGALTGNRALILPTSPTGAWSVINRTSGAYDLTVKTAAGTGVIIKQGYARDVASDGTNIVASDSDVPRAAVLDGDANPTISGGTLTVDLSNAGVHSVALNANITTLTISNIPTGKVAVGFLLLFTADGTSRSVTWPASVKWAAGTAPTLTSTNGKKDLFAFISDDNGTSYQGIVLGQNY